MRATSKQPLGAIYASEAKSDHVLSDEQIERESQVAENLVLLLLDVNDSYRINRLPNT